MSEREQVHVDQATNVLAPVVAAAQKQFEAFAQAQLDLRKKTSDISHYWVDRGHYEANMASELSAKLAAAHSIPEAMTAWQEWGKQRFERMTEDSKHLVADIQEVMKSSASLMPKNDA